MGFQNENYCFPSAFAAIVLLGVFNPDLLVLDRVCSQFIYGKQHLDWVGKGTRVSGQMGSTGPFLDWRVFDAGKAPVVPRVVNRTCFRMQFLLWATSRKDRQEWPI